jgi:ABC-type amino acid transport system permease subunit
MPNFAEALYLYAQRLPTALLVTCVVTAGAVAVALSLGLLLAAGRRAGTIVAGLSFAVVSVGRCIPLPPLQFLVYFTLLSMMPIEPIYAGMLAIGLQFAPYMAELFRSGIAAVPPGQVEAAYALGMARIVVGRRVILPIGLRIMIPAIGQMIVGMLINSAFVSQIGAKDVTGMARNIINAMFTTELWVVVALTYFVIAFPISRALSWLERKMVAEM